ncbi:MAG: zf-HC2 domain-containing protein [Acidobacteriaceae bacterium]|nr:zf-HC2 domain-containing protein [Acidobacteriaceae bacterium]
MKGCEEVSHLPSALLIKAIDEELPGGEAQEVESHLATCDSCRRRYQALRQVSGRIESAVAARQVELSSEQRTRLETELDARELAARAKPGASHVVRRLSWAVAIAAALAFLLLVAPQWRQSVKRTGSAAAAQPSAFEVDGESFVALPYSNPDLPLNTSHIVQMQVPVQSLADAGIVFEPISNEVAAQDRSVLADVLLGMDGRPVGIHVLASE